MRILIWHVHGSWTTAFVAGRHTYLLPVLPDRGRDGLGRARTWDWPASAVELTPAELADTAIDLVVLQRPEEIELAERWTGRRPARDLPAVYVEHDAPRGHAATSRHPLADQTAIPIVHVTHFNRVMWDNGTAPTFVVEHGVIDPGHRYTGEIPSLAVVVNEPVRRGRVAGTDIVTGLAADLPVDVYGMGVGALAALAPDRRWRLHEDYPQQRLHAALGAHGAYLHPYRWTSLGLALIEAMTLGLPVLGLSTTEGPRAVPPAAGLLSNDLTALADRARRWLADPDEARAAGVAARRHALAHYGIDRFLTDWDDLLEKVSR